MAVKKTVEQILDENPCIRDVEVHDSRRSIKSYVLRTSKLSKTEEEAIGLYYKDYGVGYRAELVDPADLFKVKRPVIMEIGFGDGEPTFQIAQSRPQYNYLGLEVYLNGFCSLLDKVGKAGLDNVKMMRFDAAEVLSTMIEPGSVDGFHIFFPDPWPKKKHQKRRLLNEGFARTLASRLKEGGYIYFVTDWQDYANQALEVLEHTQDLVNEYDGFASSMPWRPLTRFERKGLVQDFPISELWFVKKSR